MLKPLQVRSCVQYGDLGVVVVEITGVRILGIEATTGEVTCTVRWSWGCSCKDHRCVSPWCWSHYRWGHVYSRANSPAVRMMRWSCLQYRLHTSLDRSSPSVTFCMTPRDTSRMQTSRASLHTGSGSSESKEQTRSSFFASVSMHKSTQQGEMSVAILQSNRATAGEVNFGIKQVR